MKRCLLWLAIVCSASLCARSQSYLGFDRNQYPGDENLTALRQTFTFSGYWLNTPPGEKQNDWVGKRRLIESKGFGFLVLFNGRLYRSLKNEAKAAALGKSDAQTAVEAAKREGFPAHTVLFLDQEEGGRMLPEQRAYIHAWADGVIAAGYGAGVYCSGMAAKDAAIEQIITAEDIRKNVGGRKIRYFVTGDACPPSPGCSFPKHPPSPAASGMVFAEVWQFAQSPRRKDVTAACAKSYNRDGECYAPGTQVHVDLDTALSNDPSGGRVR